MRIQPARDWRFWACILGVLVCIIVFVAYFVTLNAYDDVKAQNGELKTAQQAQATAATCRSEAQAAVNEAQAEFLVAQGHQFSVLGRIVSDALISGIPVDGAYLAELEAASAEVDRTASVLDAATDAQGNIVERCNEAITPKGDTP